MKRLAIILISLATAIGGVAPAQAFPSIPAPKIDTSNVVEQVDHRRGHRWHRQRHYGHRHDRHRRHYSHRRHRNNNAGAIIGGLAAGAIIGGAIASSRQPSYSRGGNDHVNWCYSQYRSYRAYDNTFQPYNGPRRQCRSPF